VNAKRVTPLKALLLATSAGLTLAVASYALHRAGIGSVAVGIGVAVMLFVMFAFPEAANRRVWGKREHARTPVSLRRVVIRVGVVGLCFLALAIWLQSWPIALVAVGYLVFWTSLIYFDRDRLGT
jgi:4-hydroxybenzoate polyprenyltransferase